jgi:uncharacterized protein YcnI
MMVISGGIATTLFGYSPAAAHVVLAVPSHAPDSDYVAAFKIGHGCEGSPTISLRVEFPEEIAVTDVPDMPGWLVSRDETGGRIAAATWEGRLEATASAEFLVEMRLPAREGLVYFPAIQSCETGERRWTTIPPEGAAWNSVPTPAPVLELTSTPLPADPHAHH